MKAKKLKLSFNKTTVADLGKIYGGHDDTIKVSAAETCQTNCDRDTNCYAISLCWTVCGGMACV